MNLTSDHGPASQPLAIIGMGCRLPGAANLDEYWRLIVEGRSAIRELPPDRWNPELYFDPQVGVRGKTYSRLAATLESREFDRNACPISDDLIRSVDNAHLLMCGVAAEALRHAGIDPFNVPLKNTGVYIGHAQGSELGCNYTYSTCIAEAAEFLREVPQVQQLPQHEQDALVQALIDSVRRGLPTQSRDARDVAASMIAGTISKAFGLTGPFLALNSACASSLQAMLVGARALQLGHIDMAIIGGASDCKGDTLVLFSHAQAMSATGSRPFDADADGLIVGEGYVAVVMKRLDRALSDGDRILAVVRGLGASSDGKGKSLWAPRKEGQVKSMERAYRSGVEIAGLQYVEAHSTATQLGDATELNTLAEFLGPHLPPGRKIPVTSVKANIGHTLESAGLAGVIKVVLCMQHGVIPGAINVQTPNPEIDWANAPVFVPTTTIPWPAPPNGQPRRAGVNAFGIGGLNMHVVLDEYTESCRALITPTSPARDTSLRSHGEDAVAVIGRGCLFAGAPNLREYWRLLESGADPKQPVPADRWPSGILRRVTGRNGASAPLIGGFITRYQHDWRRHKIPPKQIQQADPLQFMLLDAMDEAFAEAGYDRRDFDRTRAGVVVGTEFGGDFAFQLQMGLRLPELEVHIRRLLEERGIPDAQAAARKFNDVLLSHWPALIDETGSFSTSTLASRLAKTWNLMGGAAAIDAGDASSLTALATAVDMLLAHDCDLMVCAGAQRRMGLPEYETLDLQGLLPSGRPRSPLDAEYDGYAPGEGVGVVLLKRLSDALRDGDPIQCIIRRVSAAHAAEPATATALALQRGLQGSGLPSEQLGIIEIDGGSTREITSAQLSAIARVQADARRERPLWLSSVVSQIGHTQGAAGVASLLKASLEFTHQELPATHGVAQIAPPVATHSDHLQVPRQRTPLSLDPDRPMAAGVLSFSRGLAMTVLLEPACRADKLLNSARTSTVKMSTSHPAPAESNSGAAPSVQVAELETFLINFVVEQTGYPPEVVELDADLEADLGIDSIKKAQLFGELREYFDITPTAGLTLDDFPTLRHIVRFLAEFGSRSASHADAPQHNSVEHFGPPAPAAHAPAASAPRSADPVIDSHSNGHPVAPVPALPEPEVVRSNDEHQQAAPAPDSSAQLASLESFLINFVVEQTGYPPEVVELDADLEADLGIDSIKKAQLFGELQEYFDITPTEGMTLDDFPTLRHVLNFLAVAASPADKSESAAAPEATRTPPTPARRDDASESQLPVDSAASESSAQRPSAPRNPLPDNAWTIVRFGGESWEDVRRALTEAAAAPHAVYARASAGEFLPSQRFRVAIVADSPATLARKLEQALGALANPKARRPLENQAIFLREVQDRRPRIAFVFAGQGSQYTGMLRPLVEFSPAAQQVLGEMNKVLAACGQPAFEEIAWSSTSPLGIDVRTTQLAVLLADYLMLQEVSARGIEPDLVLGHSYGEYAALLAAGAWDLDEAIRITCARTDAIEAHGATHTGMLATSAPAAEIRELAESLADRVYVANLNAPDQNVVGGPLSALHELEAQLKSRGHHTRLLPVPCAFHTPLLKPAAEHFAGALKTARISAPRQLVYSVANNRPVTRADEVRSNLVAHLTSPVRYMDLIRQLAQEAPTVFVEIGPQQALTRLNARILADVSADLIATDNPQRTPAEQLLHVQALLEVCGALDNRRQPPAPARPTTGILHFDATARRRARARESAGKTTATVTAAVAEQGTSRSPHPFVAPANTDRSRSTVHAPSIPSQIAERMAGPAPQAAPAATPAATAAPAPMPNSAGSEALAASRAASAPATNSATVETPTPPRPATHELEAFLINFVVEHTGYPPEVVELDADLEADLGIDSIKKAQLFGELQEYFDVTPGEGVTLDDFPTLRHVVRFLAGESASTPSHTGNAPPAQTGSLNGQADRYPPVAPADDEPQFTPAESAPHDVSPIPISVMQLRGSAYEIGRQHGATLQDAIRRALRHIADLSGQFPGELPIPLDIAANPEAFFGRELMDELRGIADGAAVSLESIVAWNLLLLAELGSGATHVVVRPAESDFPVHALRDDLFLMGTLSECITPVVLLREETGRIPWAGVGIAGFVGALGGMNAQRLTLNGFSPQPLPVERHAARNPLLFTGRLLSTASDPDRVLETLRATAAGDWTCCLSHAGSRAAWTVRCAAGHVTAESRPFTVINCGETLSLSPDRLSGIRNTEDLQQLLWQASSGSMARCVAVLDPAAAEITVRHGGADGIHQAAHVPVGGILGDFVDVPTVDSNPSAPTEDAAIAAADAFIHLETRTQRFVMSTIPAPLPPGCPSVWKPKGSAIIVGRNEYADALARHIESQGGRVHRLGSRTLDAAEAELAQIHRELPATHLFLALSRDHDVPGLTDAGGWERIYEDQILFPYFVCRRWLQLAGESGHISDCSVVALTHLGGDFGFGGRVAAPQSGALTGLMKALFLEYSVIHGHNGFVAKAIDAPAGEDPDSLADQVLRELASGAIDYEVAFRDGRRFLQLASHKPARVSPHASIRPGSCWVVTGGARGITAESAFELGKRFRLRLHLIGTSPAPNLPPDKRNLDPEALERWKNEVMIAARAQRAKPNAAWTQIEKALEIDRTLQRFREAEIAVTYHSCDVGDRQALAAVLDEIRRTDGPIEGILHGAGIERSCRFERKTMENVRATFDAKIAGACHLMLLTQNDPVRHFIAYGSISGRLGSYGQSDYSAASDMLCKLTTWYRTWRPEVRAIAFHWHPWDGVGMAVRPETRASLARSNGPDLMPLREGLQHLVREVSSPREDCEVLITDREFHRRYYPEPSPAPETTPPQLEPQRPTQPEPAGTPDPLVTAERTVDARTKEGNPQERSDEPPLARIASRHVERLVEAPLPATAQTWRYGSALIVGDNAAARALQNRLAAEGIETTLLPSADPEHVLGRLDAVCADARSRALFVMTERDESALSLDDRDALRTCSSTRVLFAYRIIQRWYQHVRRSAADAPAAIVAVTSLGGAFGLEGPVPSPSGGALTGLLKSIHVENVRDHSGLYRVKVIDAPPDEPPAQLADAVCRELLSDSTDIEVAWSRDRRRIVMCDRQPAVPSHKDLPRPGSVWLVTGGARGITAAAARELARKYNLKLHLVGTSPPPQPDAPWRNLSDAELKALKRRIVLQAVSKGRSPEEDWERIRKDGEIFKTLTEMERAGVSAVYHRCDLADWNAVESLLAEIRTADGPIEGIIHGAGYAKSARLESQSLDRVRRTIAPKLDGTLALMTLTAADPLRHFIAFGSLSGRFGGNGLSDYAAANDALSKLCGWFRAQRPECRTTCFHWQTWDRIGMAMYSDGLEITRSAFKMEFMSPDEGIAHLLDEVAAGLPEREILITDGYFQNYFYPQAGHQSDAAASVSAPAANVPSSAGRYPLLADSAERAAGGSEWTARIQLDPVGDPFLAQHRLRGKPFLPAVVGVEALLEAASAYDAAQPVHCIRDVEIVNGLSFPTADPQVAAVSVQREGTAFVCRLTTELRDRQGRIVNPQRLHVTGTVDRPQPMPSLPQSGPGRPPLGWFPHTYSDGGPITHGPAFRCLTDIALQYDGAWGRIIAPAPAELSGNRPTNWLVPLAVLDACLVTCGSFVYMQFGGQIEVPHGFERLHVFRQPHTGEECIVRVHFRGRDDRHSRFDFTLYGANDEPLLSAVGYRTIRVGGGTT